MPRDSCGSASYVCQQPRPSHEAASQVSDETQHKALIHTTFRHSVMRPDYSGGGLREYLNHVHGTTSDCSFPISPTFTLCRRGTCGRSRSPADRRGAVSESRTGLFASMAVVHALFRGRTMARHELLRLAGTGLVSAQPGV